MVSQDEQRNTPTDAPFASAAGDQDVHAQNAHAEYADEYPAYVSLLRNLPATPPYELGDYDLRHMPAGSQDSGWQNCLNSVEKYDRELCQAYREQIDTLLVFAGLFSAVVTAFAVESYQWLQDDPIDTSLELLRDVVDLLSRNLNSTVPSLHISTQKLSDPAIVRINTCWFLSLTLSLSAALVGILCKQWLREFERNVGQSPEDALAVRYIRFQGFESWKVGTIVTSVPIIMQMALAFFIIGIIELLWRLHVVVACCVTVTAGLTLAFYLATTLLPVLQYAYICMRCCVRTFRTRDYPFVQAYTEPQCAFKSAQAWLAFRVTQPILNRILKGYGYKFASHRPPEIFDHTLRPTDSWVDFDLNWVRCRENINVGPRCAFESLSWIARNLGEMHLSSWIWHCVWARWQKNRDSPEDLIVATRDIECVARSYPTIAALGDTHSQRARSQALIFHCSLRADLPVDTAFELLLRLAAVSGNTSQWTMEALHAIRVVYRHQVIRMSDDIAIRLFHLAKLQVYAILHGVISPSSATQHDAALTFREIAVMLHRGTPLHDIMMPAMSGLVLQWLRSRPPRPIATVGRAVFEDIVRCLVSEGYRDVGLPALRQRRGIMFIAKLAGEVAEIWPEERHVYERNPEERAVLWELLAIFSDGFPELSQNGLAARMDPEPQSSDPAGGERSSPPGPNLHSEPPAAEGAEGPGTEQANPLVGECEAFQPSLRGDLCSDVQGGESAI